MVYRSHILKTEIEYLKGVGPARAAVLKKYLELFTFDDLLNYFPFRYVDRSKIYKIADINSDAAQIQIQGVVSRVSEIGTGKSKRLIATLKDDSGSIELVWFKGQKWMKQIVKEGYEYLVFCKPSRFNSIYNMVHPEIELYAERDERKAKVKFQPVYSSSENAVAKGLDSKGIFKLQIELQSILSWNIPEILPAEILKKFKLISRKEAYQIIHFPKDLAEVEKARNRLKFEELFVLQFELLKYKQNRGKAYKGFMFTTVGEYFNTFYHNILPFELTNAQKRVIKEIRIDMKSGRQMNRLLQGDVGSGKTIVALMSMLIAIDNGYQAVIIAPTEILANQHFQNMQSLTQELGLQVGLLTGSSKAAVRKKLDEELRSGNMHIVIGTHALLEEKVVFKKLGLAIIDEQHRFGVAQRARLWAKSKTPPHVLVMTATPIPRTLAMTFYGDLDTSVIDELPPGRKEIITKHYFEKSRLAVQGSMKKIIQKGQQVYIVYPLIQESETLDYQNLMDGYDVIARDFPRPEYQLGIVHGKMKSEDKEQEMARFKKGELHILVSTTVIEVGVDVPNATAMIIESAERFGLSQLHQLRGRVGRGGDQSYCILMTGNKLTTDARTRLETMVRTNDGFKIAEVDLNIRGPGDLAGTQQSGLMNFRIANLATDHKILNAARVAASHIIENDPELIDPENQGLKLFLKEQAQQKFNWSKIS
ncbi:MAG: ATP-dependent DNA helicase RecG [Bacteroidetes bacterium]|nr:ATP-dependent DNA helicase RecG [Bacteroidota bacterium]MBT5991422.1 ATP-dependent DNA helicase RecG [Bacteroidota bacterium]